MRKPYFTLAPICAESAFKRYLELPADPDEELRLQDETNLLFLPFYTDEIPFEFWKEETQYQDADVLMLMLDPTDPESYSYLMAQLVILRIKKAPVILVEFVSPAESVAAAGGAGAAASPMSLGYRNSPVYQALIAAFGIKSKHCYAINLQTERRKILIKRLFEGLKEFRALSGSRVGIARAVRAGTDTSAAVTVSLEPISRAVRRARIVELTSLNLFRLFGATEEHIAEARAPLSPGFGAASASSSFMDEIMRAINGISASGLGIEEVTRRGFEFGFGMARRLHESGVGLGEFAEASIGAAVRIAEMLGVAESTRPVEPFVLKPNPVNERFEILRNKVAEIKKQLCGKTADEAAALLKAAEELDSKLDSFSTDYCCPISGEIMQHPIRVGSGDGKSIFDKNSLQELLRRAKAEKKNATCPLTRVELTKGEGEGRRWISPPEEASDKKVEILEALCRLELLEDDISKQLAHLLSSETASATAAGPSPA